MSVARAHVFDDLKKAGWEREPIHKSTSIRLYDESSTVPQVKKFPLRKFISDGKVVVSDKPVQVTIFTEENNYFAENEALRIYAVGNSIKSVVDEFSQHIVYFYEYYRQKESEEVMGRAAKLKHLYENHFKLV